MTPDSDFKIMSEHCKNGIFDILISGNSGITLRSCGIDRDEVIGRLKSEIIELESRLNWPDEKRIDVIGQNGNDGDHYEAVQI